MGVTEMGDDSQHTTVDLMHNDENNAFAARTCIVVVVVTLESNMASSFSWSRKFKWQKCWRVLMWLTSSNGSGDLFKLSDRSNTTYFYYFPTTSTTDRHLVFERDYNYHTTFRVLTLTWASANFQPCALRKKSRMASDAKLKQHCKWQIEKFRLNFSNCHERQCSFNKPFTLVDDYFKFSFDMIWFNFIYRQNDFIHGNWAP